MSTKEKNEEKKEKKKRGGYKYLTITQRQKIEVLALAGLKQKEIAALVGTSPSTICRELKRGQYWHTVDYKEVKRYSPEFAQQKYEEARQNRGVNLKIGKDHEYANYLERRVLEGLSPAAVLGELKAKGKEKDFKTKICVTTFYSYIEKGVFLNLTLKDLPEKEKRGKNRKKHVKRQKKANAGTSIEQRPEEVDNREEFGHWEMDSVVGPQGKGSATMLTITERKTRKEITLKMPDKSAINVVHALDQLEMEWGKLFTTVFKSITVDNGTEFALCEDMEKSIHGEKKRTKMYYCHAYCSSERGTNENLNRMARRKVPKGTIFDNMTEEEIRSIADWMNNYPRKILGFHTAQEEFNKEIAKIKAAVV